MNNRDPFSIRRASPALTLLQTEAYRAAQASQRAGLRVIDTLKNTVEDLTSASMATLPNGTSHQYHNPDSWQGSGQSQYAPPLTQQGAGMGGKITNFFTEKESLPMYKDKPYNYPGGHRRGPWYKSKRAFGILLFAFTILVWWSGLLSSSPIHHSRLSSSTPGWFTNTRGRVDWQELADHVREVFQESFGDYEKHGWGEDEYHPISKTARQMVPNGMGWIIVDALDTMMIMNLTKELTHARQWIHESLSYDQDHDVNTFETTIRMLGGLLSAHYLSTQFPGKYAPVSDGLSDDLYVEKATDLADRLSSAYSSHSGVPYASVNLHRMTGIPSHSDGGASSTAEAATLQLEMKYLAKLTGETHYWEIAEKVIAVIDEQEPADGLVPIFISADNGKFRGTNIRLGSRGDSYYEYLIKQYLQTSQQEPVYQAMWNESLAGVKKNLITYTAPSNFTIIAERQFGLEAELTPKMDHLVCFMPGTIALATTNGLTVQEARKKPNWGPQQEEDMRLAEELMKTCWGMYVVNPTGLAGEITYFNIHSPPLMYNDFPQAQKPASPKDAELKTIVPTGDEKPVLFEDFEVKPNDAHNLQRPETVESLFYMWRITGDVKYREWGAKMFESFVRHTKVEDGPAYTSISDVATIPSPERDNMESFWLAETLKYFYLLFGSNDILPLTDVVFNTEAHPLPKFEMGKLFKTGWQRKPRAHAAHAGSDAAESKTAQP